MNGKTTKSKTLQKKDYLWLTYDCFLDELFKPNEILKIEQIFFQNAQCVM